MKSTLPHPRIRRLLQKLLRHSEFPQVWRTGTHFIGGNPIKFSVVGFGAAELAETLYAQYDILTRERATFAEILLNKFENIDVKEEDNISISIYTKDNSL